MFATGEYTDTACRRTLTYSLTNIGPGPKAKIKLKEGS